MNKFEYMVQYGYEQLCFFQDKSTGLKAIICIHNTVLGPALGGTRFYGYNDEEQAAEDVLRLARGMTYKSAMAGLNLGGGKAVILGDPNVLRKDCTKAEAFWRTFGRFIEGLGGRYITAEDVGTTTQDMLYINMETDYVVGLTGRSGDPSPYTALGTYKAMQACCKHVYGSDSLNGKTVAVQGIGSVGYELCKLLHKEGAKLIVSNRSPEKAERAVNEFGAVKIDIDKISSVQCDIFAPCALGAVINDETIKNLKCKIVCGAANNVLKDAQAHGKALFDKGIAYAPDYVANAGGLINVSFELANGGYNETASVEKINKIYDRISEILHKSKQTKQPTNKIADQMAETRIAAVKETKSILI